jgi:hypothetical protein
MTFTVEKTGWKIWATSVIFKKLPKVNNHPMGEIGPNLVTMVPGCEVLYLFLLFVLLCMYYFSFEYGLYEYGLYEYGLYEYGLYEYGLYEYGLYEYGLYEITFLAQ